MARSAPTRSTSGTRSRQRGTERSMSPLPSQHPRPTLRKLVWSRLAIWITVALWSLYILTALLAIAQGGAFVDVWDLVGTIGYLAVVTVLAFSALMYLVTRLGAFERFASHHRTSRSELDHHMSAPRGGLTLLIPSYAEEPELVRQALWSAALQEHPALEVVLLIDDTPHPSDVADAERLDRTRLLVDEIAAALESERMRVAQVLADLDSGATIGIAEVAREYDHAASWLAASAEAEPRNDHIGVFFADQVIGGLARLLRATADALNAAPDDETLPVARLRELLQRLERIFSARMQSFERKRYASLSHEPNKAMNLNAYLGLMGGRYRETNGREGLELVPVAEDEPFAVDAPAAQYVLTLDADSMLLPEYAVRLVHLMDQPENQRVAVAQTPYSSFRGAVTRIERFASATTDVQHIVHQGLTAFDATFWVGANAVIRRTALDDIVVVERVDGREVPRYVQDRTVIEDTESSIDLMAHDWSLVNYPERLSYSTTPRDFGSLVVQRRRWANGGLLILPKLFGLIRRRRRERRPVPLRASLLRANYLASIAWSSFGMLLLMVSFPFNGLLVNPLLALVAVPYFISMASDLRYSGYHRRDVVGVYGINLLLLAVNIAGVVGSLAQAVTGQRSRFARTPKVENRTVSPALYVIAPCAIAGFSLWVAVIAVVSGAWGTLGFSLLNLLCALWASFRLIGFGNTLGDIWAGWLNWIWVDERPRDPAPAATAPDWRAMLDDGPAEAPQRPARRGRTRHATAEVTSP